MKVLLGALILAVSLSAQADKKNIVQGVVEERMAAVTSLEGKRQAVKAKYPKGG